jgi:hypothetical protein
MYADTPTITLPKIERLSALHDERNLLREDLESFLYCLRDARRLRADPGEIDALEVNVRLTVKNLARLDDRIERLTESMTGAPFMLKNSVLNISDVRSWAAQ